MNTFDNRVVIGKLITMIYSVDGYIEMIGDSNCNNDISVIGGDDNENDIQKSPPASCQYDLFLENYIYFFNNSLPFVL